MSEPASRKRLTGAERAAQFLAQAACIVRDGGAEALSMEGLAAACGVNKALPYRYFANRDDVLVSLYVKQNEDFDQALEAAMQGVTSFAESISALVNVWSTLDEQGEGLPALQEARTQDGRLEALRAARTRDSVTYIAELIQTHHAITPRNAMLAAGVLLAGSRGLTATWAHTRTSRQAVNDSFVKMALGAVQALAEATEQT